MSALRVAAEDYLTIRRALGYKLNRQGLALLSFVSYAEEAQASTVTSELALTWAMQPSNAMPQYWRQRLSVVRGFAQHMQTLDPNTEVPPTDLLPALPPKRAVPYLYSEAEIQRLMQATETIAQPLRAATYNTLIGLLAVSGLRIGEAIALDRDDLDLSAGLLLVRAGKNGKPREVPLHPSTVAALGDYARLRDELHPHPRMPSFFISTAGTRLDQGTVWKEFTRFRHHAGVHAPPGARPPRLHDLRHVFVFRTLLNWYRSGADVEARLPQLSTYLGHVDPASTYWYFQAAPELLALAAQRLERHEGSHS
jgi:integrase/recombinase XerD